MSIETIRPERLSGEWTLTSSPRLKPGGGKSTGQGNRSVKAGSGQGRAGGLEEGSGCGGIRLGEGPDGENTAEPARQTLSQYVHCE